MSELLLVIRTGMGQEEGVRWLGADVAHSEIMRLLDRRMGDRVPSQLIEDVSDELMEMLFKLGKPPEAKS